MRKGRRFGNAISLALAAMALSVTTPQAQADDLFRMLFGGGVKPGAAGAFPPPPAQKPQAAVARTKIAGPGYNEYKADALVRVDFSAISETMRPAMLAVDASLFPDAAAGLNGFDLLAEKAIAKGLQVYYEANRDFLWVEGTAPNLRAIEAVRLLGEAASHGLDPGDYRVDVPADHAADRDARLRDLIRFEMTLSAKVLRYVRDAQGGRIDPNRISGYYDFPAKPFDPTAILQTVAHTQDVRTFLESRQPQNAEYQAMRVELEMLEASSEIAVVIDPKILLKPGQSSPELPKVLSVVASNLDDEMGGEFGETLVRLVGSQDYVPELVPIIKAKQEQLGLKGDGVIGPRTVEAMVGTSRADRMAKLLVAMEQIRWLPSDLGSPRVFINQPAYTASYIEGNEAKLTTRTVVGSPTNQTSFFYDEIEQVDYNPYWGVPRSILVNEMLPRLMRDPGYLDRAGYEVTDGKGKRVPSAAVDWGSYGNNIPFDVRQTPSEANALGELKILFPNKHAIYMHDTPQKTLFERDMRAFSHGCVRLADPRGMAAAVLGTDRDYIAAKLAKGHSSEKVSRKIPVYVSYFTAWPDLSGKVEYFADVYGRDARVQTAIEKTEAVRTQTSG